MEDLKRSLLAGSNSAIVLQAASKLLSSASSPTNSDDIEEALKVVWSMIGSGSALTAQACSDVITHLVKNGKLEIGTTVTQLLASLSHGMEFHGIVPALGNIICYQSEVIFERKGEYQNPYAISSSQHPFISVLRSTPATWSLVLDQCLEILNHSRDVIRNNALAILRPVLLYLFCDPNHHLHFGSMRANLFDSLLELSKENDEVFTFLMDMVDWFQLDNKASLPEIAQYLYKLFDAAFNQKLQKIIEPKVYILASLSLYQAKYGQSPTRSINWLNRFFEENADVNWDVILVVLDQVVKSCSHVHHSTIFSLALSLVESGKTSQLVTGMLASTALQSLSFPPTLGGEGALKKAELVRRFYKIEWDVNNKNLQNINHVFDLHISSAVETVKVCSLISNSSLAQHWLKSMKTLPHSQLSRHMSLLCSLFLCSSESVEAQLSLDLLLSVVSEQPDTSSTVLTLLLHKLASKNKTSDENIKLALLQALPSMAGDKGCISLIMKLVSSLSSKSSLAPLRLSLLAKLWRIESRCYPFLQKALLEPAPASCIHEFQVTQAAIIRDIVDTHATQYGSDLLPILSNLLNQCGGQEGTTAAKIALEGIYSLCKSKVIDMRSTIKILSPKCGKDRRPLVSIEYIKLLGLSPSFRLSGKEYLDFLSDTINWLWKNVMNVDDTSVIKALYEAIACFPLEASKLRMLPIGAREGLKLPPKYCATPAEAARKPEDVLPYIPSECWVKLLASVTGETEQSGVEKLICSLTREEVTNLPRAVYSLSQAMQNAGTEPVNYNHLPEHSVIRGIIGHIIQNGTNRKELPKHPAQLQDENRILSACLRILAADHGRPLPPLDWSLLEPFFSDSALQGLVIDVLSRQAVHSRSARIAVERQLAQEQGRDTTMHYMRNLLLIGEAVPPQILSTWLNKALQNGLHITVHGENSASLDLSSMLSKLREAIELKTIPEPNQLCLNQAVENLHEKIPADKEELYEVYLSAATKLPLKNIERMSSPAVWWEVTPAKMYRATSLRTALAMSDDTDTPLTWLNELLEVASKQAGDYTFLFRSLLSVITKCRVTKKQVTTSWLLELMGQISALLRKAGPQKPAGPAIPFMIDVFNLAIIAMTETDSLLIPRDQICVSRASRLSALSLATCRLANHYPGLAGQLAEWCLQVSRHDEVVSPHKEGLRAATRVFKHSSNWQEASMWGKLVVSNV